jgi:hypothetical protein
VNGVPRLILASASPARRNLLAAAGFDATTIVSGVDESTVDSDSAEELCMTLARLKAEAVATHVTDDVVVGCDSVLAFEGRTSPVSGGTRCGADPGPSTLDTAYSGVPGGPKALPPRSSGSPR